MVSRQSVLDAVEDEDENKLKFAAIEIVQERIG